VPERPGDFVVPPFRVATFDPRSGTYGVAESQGLVLTAAGNPVAQPAAADGEPAPAAEQDEDQGAIGPVRTASALWRGAVPIAARPWYPWVALAMPLAWLALVLGGAVRRRLAHAEAQSPRRTARDVRKKLAVAEAAARAGDARGCYAGIAVALRAAIEGRLGETVGSLTHAQLRRRLVERGMGEELARSIEGELEGIDFARYSAAAAAKDELAAALGRTRDLLASLDRFVPTREEA